MNNQEVLDKPTSKVAVYNPIEAGIALMLEKHGHVIKSPPVVRDDPKAPKAAKTNRMELVRFRTTLDDVRKAEKAESLAYGRLVDSEAKRIQAIADPIEPAYSAVIDAEESRLEALKLERARVEGHRARIQAIKDVRGLANLVRTARDVHQLIEGMPKHLDAPFEEFQDEAQAAHDDVLVVLIELHSIKVEAEQAAIELANQQAALAAQKAEADRVEAERRAAAKAEADAAAAKLKAERDAFEAEQAEVRRRQKIEDARLAAQQREIDAQQATQKAIEDAAKAPPVVAPTVVIVEVDDVPAVKPVPLRMPEASELIEAISEKFTVPDFIAAEWITRRFKEIKAYTD